MKLKYLTTTTAALLGTAMVGYAQVETERSRSASEGGLHTSEATRMYEGDQPGPASERQADRAQAQAERTADQAPDMDAEDMNQAAEPGERTPGLDTQRDRRQQQGAGRQDNVDWEGSDHQDMDLDEVSAEIRQGLQAAAGGREIDDEVTKIRFGDRELYRAKADVEDGEDLHVYVDASGTLVKTQQEVETDSVPQAVRDAFRNLSQGDREVEKVLREVSDGKTSFIAEIDRDDQPTRWVQLDESGQVIKSHEKQDD